MKYKHGFIGNSSSASYYIRRGENGSRNANAVITSPASSSAEVAISGGHTYDSYYSWHPNSTGRMQASLVVPIHNAYISKGGVTSISFWFYAASIPGHAAAGFSPATVDTAFAGLSPIGCCRFIEISGKNYKNEWSQTLTGTPGSGKGSLTGVTLTVAWDGSRLKINGSFKQPTSTTMSCAIGIHSFTAVQDGYLTA